jgi:hypothetical protein
MRRHLFNAVLLLLFADVASAAIAFDPPQVREHEPFEMLLRTISGSSPPPGAPFLRIAPGQITVELLRNAGPATAISKHGERVRVDGVPAGTYEVVFRTISGILERTTLVVLPKPFSVAPAFGAGDTEVLIEGIRGCAPGTGTCATPVVRFGSEEGYDVQFTPAGDITARTPYIFGRVDVTVTAGGVTRTLPGGYVGVSSGAPPDLALMEKVLLPLNFRGEGAQGADWRTETVVRSDAPIRVPTEPLVYFELLLPDLQAFTPLAPGVHVPFPQESVEGGVYFYAPLGLEKRLTYKSHILDRSRSTTDRGTELPVVRVEDTAAEIRLMDVPLGPLFRTRLRIYDFDTVEDREIQVLITKADGTLIHHQLAVTRVPPCVTPPCAMYRSPFVAIDLSSISALANAGEVDITIRAETNDARLWAFASVSNNETQRVTLYTPLHKTGVAR